MKKNTLISGLVATMVISFAVPAYVVADSVGVSSAIENQVDKGAMSLSLDQAIDYALKHSKEIEISNIELQKAEIAYDENTRAIKKIEKELDETSQVVIPFYLTDENDINRILLKNGAVNKSVELTYHTAKWNKETTINKIKYDVEKAYFDLLHAKEDLLIAEESLRLAEELYEQGKLKYELGNISKQELLGFELNLSQAQSVYDSSKLKYDMQMMSFKDTLGIPFSENVVLTDSIEYKKHGEIDLDASIEKALNNNAGIKIAEENYEISKMIFDAIKVKYPEFSYKYKSYEVQAANAAKNLENAKKGVEMGVRSAYLNLITAEKLINTYQKTVEQAERALDIAKISFELGMAIPSDITKANIDLINAKKNLSQQIHAYNLALLNYEYSTSVGMGNLYGSTK